MPSLRPVSAEEIESLAIGAWILGTGGGGSPYLALLNMRQLYGQGVVCRLMDASELADDDPELVRALKKSDPQRMAEVLGTLVVAIRMLAEAVWPVIPASAEKLIELIDSGKDGAPIPQPTPIFPRLELPKEEEAA